MNLGIEGKVALVTGSSRGIGAAVARQFALEGARVAITFRTQRDRAEALAEEIRAQGGEAIVLPLDIASFESIGRLAAAVLDRWGQIDILVNNAMKWGPGRMADAVPFEQLSGKEWEPLLHANTAGPFLMTQEVVPSMRAHGWGRIVNVSSVSAEDGLPKGGGWYSAAKASLHGLTRALSKELGPSGILVNVVMPGLTATDRINLIAPEVRSRVEAASPIRRVLQPDEVASAVVFLGSDRNTAITGEMLRVSGGPA
jgi:3-oxoacyl-[acyl-carrier protein] reductase